MKLPREWTQQGVVKQYSTPRAVTAMGKKVTARIDMSEDVAGAGLCPECKEEMQPVIANGIDCLCCMNCRIVLPQKTADAEKEE
nr:MAG TPA: TFIIB Transcription factor zinc-finger [Caudoviricetes sp.]